MQEYDWITHIDSYFVVIKLRWKLQPKILDSLI